MKGAFLVISAFLAIFLAGCAGSPTNAGTANTDCGANFPCFVAAMEANCSSAKVNVTENGATAVFQVLGTNQNGSCNVLIKISDISRTAGMSDETWNMISSSKGVLPMLDMTCPISAQKAQSLYDGRQLLAAQEVFNSCQGSLKEVALLLASQGAPAAG